MMVDRIYRLSREKYQDEPTRITAKCIIVQIQAELPICCIVQ